MLDEFYAVIREQLEEGVVERAPAEVTGREFYDNVASLWEKMLRRNANKGRREGSLLITLAWVRFQVKFPYFVCELIEYILQLVAR